MDQRDRAAIEGLFERIARVEQRSGPRDRGAEAFIRSEIAGQPGAPYYMAQTIVVQEQALNDAQRRIEELESGCKAAGDRRDCSAACSALGRLAGDRCADARRDMSAVGAGRGRGLPCRRRADGDGRGRWRPARQHARRLVAPDRCVRAGTRRGRPIFPTARRRRRCRSGGRRWLRRFRLRRFLTRRLGRASVPPEARIAPIRSSAPCRMKAAAAASIFSARFLRERSASSMARSAAAVDSRSSQSATGSVGQGSEIAQEGARRLSARALRAVHVDRQAEDQAADLFAGAERKQLLGVLARIWCGGWCGRAWRCFSPGSESAMPIVLVPRSSPASRAPGARRSARLRSGCLGSLRRWPSQPRPKASESALLSSAITDELSTPPWENE